MKRPDDLPIGKDLDEYALSYENHVTFGNLYHVIARVKDIVTVDAIYSVSKKTWHYFSPPQKLKLNELFRIGVTTDQYERLVNLAKLRVKRIVETRDFERTETLPIREKYEIIRRSIADDYERSLYAILEEESPE